jgi:SpoVK/Ycf46/Vps4 family AAA+-type ATPase
MRFECVSCAATHSVDPRTGLTIFSRTSVQVVNALLTQLDKLRNRKNVLIMTTSNIAQSIGESAC